MGKVLYYEKMKQQLAELQALQAECKRELDAYKKDAERYRWLRDSDDVLAELGMIDENALDYEVDEAIRARSKP